MDPLKRNINKPTFKDQNPLVMSAEAHTPHLEEPEELIKKFAPIITFHPSEACMPTSVESYLQKSMLVNCTTKTKVAANTKNLLQSSETSDKFYLEPKEGVSGTEDKTPAKTYVHAGAQSDLYTDLQYWFLYERTGSASAHLKWLIDGTIKGYEGKIDLNPLGVYHGNWESITVRVNNLTHEAEQVFFPQLDKGTWVPIDKVNRLGSQVLVYVSKSNHAFHPGQAFNQPAKVRFNSYSSELEFSIQYEIGEGVVMDFSKTCELISVDYPGKDKPAEPFWLNFRHHWGNPNPDYLSVPSLKRMLPQAFGKSLDFLLSKDLLDEVVTYLLFYYTDECRNKTLGPHERLK